MYNDAVTRFKFHMGLKAENFQPSGLSSWASARPGSRILGRVGPAPPGRPSHLGWPGPAQLGQAGQAWLPVTDSVPICVFSVVVCARSKFKFPRSVRGVFGSVLGVSGLELVLLSSVGHYVPTGGGPLSQKRSPDQGLWVFPGAEPAHNSENP